MIFIFLSKTISKYFNIYHTISKYLYFLVLCLLWKYITSFYTFNKDIVIENKLNMDLYRQVLNNRSTHSEPQNGFISNKHEIYTQTINKISLSSKDDKVYINDNNYNTYSIGHYKTK